MVLNSYWTPLPEIWIQHVWDRTWDSAFLTCSLVMLMLLTFRSHLSWETKMSWIQLWEEKLGGHTKEDVCALLGVPNFACIFLAFAFPCLSPGVPLHCGWPVSLDITKWWSNVLHVLFILKEKISTFPIWPCNPAFSFSKYLHLNTNSDSLLSSCPLPSPSNSYFGSSEVPGLPNWNNFKKA